MEASGTTPVPEPQFTIVKQEHQQTFNANGDPAYNWHITFKTRSGIQASVDIPENEYTAQNVAQLINTKAQQIEEVQALGTQG